MVIFKENLQRILSSTKSKDIIICGGNEMKRVFKETNRIVRIGRIGDRGTGNPRDKVESKDNYEDKVKNDCMVG